MENKYLHAIYAFNKRYNSEETKRILEYILSSDALLSRRLQRIRDTYGFNGLDYISLCDYDKRNICHPGLPEYTAFNSYIRESLSLMFPKESIKTITPEVVDYIGLSDEEEEKMYQLGLSKNKRYSDFYDEVQVKNKIALSLMSGITFPIKKMTRSSFPERFAIYIVQKQIEEVIELLIKYGYEVPTYDVDTFLPLEDEQNVKELVRTHIK